MSKLMNTIGYAGILSLASFSGAVAQMDALDVSDDELFLPEAPLATEELQAARGGFPVGGFVFDITVTILPIEISSIADDVQESIAEANQSIDAAMSDMHDTIDTAMADMTDTLDTAMNDLNSNLDTALNGGAPAVEPVAPTIDVASTNQSVPALTTPAPETVPNTSGVTTTVETPATVIVADAGNITPVTAAQTGALPETPQQVGSADMTIAAQQNLPTPEPTQTPQTPQPATAPQSLASNNTPIQPIAQGAATVETEEPPTAGMSFGLSGPTENSVVSAILPDQILQVINNTRDSVRISRNIDVNVSVPNFAFQLGLVMSGSLTSQAITNHTFLGSLQ